MCALLQRETRRALNQWCWLAQALHEARRRLHAAANEWRGASVCGAWLQWQDAVARARLMKRAVVCCLSSEVRSGWLRWVEATRRGVETQEVMLTAVFALRHLNTRRAFNGWACAASNAAIALRAQTLAAVEWRGHGLRSGWFHWRRTKGELTRLAWLAEASLCKPVSWMRRAVRHWAQAATLRAIASERLSLAIGCMRGGAVRRAMRAWRDGLRCQLQSEVAKALAEEKAVARAHVAAAKAAEAQAAARASAARKQARAAAADAAKAWALLRALSVPTEAAMGFEAGGAGEGEEAGVEISSEGPPSATVAHGHGPSREESVGGLHSSATSGSTAAARSRATLTLTVAAARLAKGWERATVEDWQSDREHI
jgi:hypothetical protein